MIKWFCVISSEEEIAEINELTEALQEFLASNRKQHSFPPTLSARQRYQVHEVKIGHIGQVTKVRLTCYLVLLSADSKTRKQPHFGDLTHMQATEYSMWTKTIL